MKKAFLSETVFLIWLINGPIIYMMEKNPEYIVLQNEPWSAISLHHEWAVWRSIKKKVRQSYSIIHEVYVYLCTS